MLESVSASHKQDPELVQTPRKGPLLPNVFFPVGEAKCSKTYTAMQLRSIGLDKMIIRLSTWQN